MNQIVSINTNVEAYRASTDAAGMCRDIVVSTAMEIQGRKYVRVEGWQSIAIAHGCTASARDVEQVDGGVRAIGEVRRMSDGKVIAEAEGFVGADEPTWFGGEVTGRYGKKTLPKRPDYAIRAMAQTRAISRACRSAFAHVVVMMDAGLQTTPAEEVPMGGFDNDETIEGDFTPTTQPRKSAYQARKDGDFEKLTKSLRECTDEASLKAWGAEHADDVGALPVGWQKEIRDEFRDKLIAFKAQTADKAGDPAAVYIEPPANEDPEAWSEYLDSVVACIQGAKDQGELAEAQRVNDRGIATAEILIDGAVQKVAAAAETRAAELSAKDAA